MVGFNNRNGMEICLGLTSTVACEKYILLFIILLLFIMLLFFQLIILIRYNSSIIWNRMKWSEGTYFYNHDVKHDGNLRKARKPPK